MDLLQEPNLSAFLISVLVLVVVALAMMQARINRRAIMVFGVAAAALVFITLRSDPALLQKYTLQIVGALIAILIAFLVFLRRRFEE